MNYVFQQSGVQSMMGCASNWFLLSEESEGDGRSQTSPTGSQRGSRMHSNFRREKFFLEHVSSAIAAETCHSLRRR